MASTKEIRRQIKSIKNTRQITKAMEMVAASKMRKSQDNATSLMPYSFESLRLLDELFERMPVLLDHPLLTKPERKSVLIFVVTSDKGLCGGFNASVIKKAIEFIDELKEKQVKFEIITIGKKALQTFSKLQYPVVADFSGQISSNPTAYQVMPLCNEYVIGGFISKKYDRVYFIYNRFISTIAQKVTIRRVVPVGENALKDLFEKSNGDAKSKSDKHFYYTFEPASRELFGHLLTRLIEAQVYEILLSSIASEHSARMIAMRNATDAAGEIIDDLTLHYNKARQAQITSEIAEVSSGAAALKSA